MTNEERKLFMEELCKRLPYGVKVNVCKGKPDDHFEITDNVLTLSQMNLDTAICGFKEVFYHVFAANVRPYLRPMMPMTEAEVNEYFGLLERDGDNLHETFESVGWLYENHFDCMGLIGKGLALEAPDGMYSK